MKSSNDFFGSIFKSPILWGCAATYLFYMLLRNGVIKNELFTRYLAGHPIEYAETGMFFVGMVALLFKFIEVNGHKNGFAAAPILPETNENRVDTRSCESYLSQITDFIRNHGATYYPKRLLRAVNYVEQCESAEQLDQELHYLADEDAINAEADYGFTQMIIWAIPILGFLGTVVGVAEAMGNLVPEELESSLPRVMEGLTVAFDTTAIALVFSIILFFTKYAISKTESKLLWDIDRMIDNELRGRFELVGTAADNSQLVLVRKMLDSMLGSIVEMSKNQYAIWEQAISSANAQAAKIASESSSQLKSALAAALRENLEHHANSLARNEDQLIKRTEGSVLAVSDSMRQNLQVVGTIQDNVVRQTEVLRNVIEATGQVAKLEDRLNQNLAALAGARNFEETVNSLAAVIHLLNSKLGTVGDKAVVQLDRPSSGKGKGQAA